MNRRIYFVPLFIVLLLSLVTFGVSNAQSGTSAEVDWHAQYWTNADLSGTPLIERTEAELDHSWGQTSPHPEINPDRFSARWTTTVTLDDGSYRFTTISDDGIRVWVDGVRLIDNWIIHPETTDTATIPLNAGQHEIRVDYFENTGLARAALSWERVAEVGNETAAISPLSGPPGTEVQVTAQGFTPNVDVTVGVGRAAAEPTSTSSTTAHTDASGALQTVATIPETAEVGEPWVVLVSSAATAEKALSQTFTVTGETAADCPDPYTVQPNDWLSRIARKCNTSVTALLAANPEITNADVIHVGTVLQIPDEEVASQVGITPESGEPGTEIQVNAIGLAPNTEVTVGIGRVNSEPTALETQTTNQDGNLDTTITLPAEAQPGEQWVVLVRSGSAEAGVLSEPFTVTAAGVTATTQVDLRLRAGPNTDSEILDVVPAGTTMSVQGATAGNDWIQVEYEGQRGWVAAWYTNLSGELSDLPTTAQMYLIALEDAGQSGQAIGCNDSVVPVTIEIEPTIAPLTAALNRLLNLEEEFYGQSGLYNALQRSDLSIQGINIENGLATIELSGQLQLGGTCDAPRVEAQLRQTALQYDTVDEVTIFVNDQPLEEVLSAQ